MKRLKYTIANWKMNGTRDSLNLIKSVSKYVHISRHKNSKIVICPPFTLLSQSLNYLKNISYGGQDCHQLNNGAFTGSISAEMLRDIGCKYVIIGHSERREYYKESSRELRLKLSSAMNNKLTAIYCIGETQNQKKRRTQILKSQINSLPKKFDSKKLIIAYEPVWAIGTGKVPTSEDINKIHLKIRALLANKIGVGKSKKISILYGGSVNASNASQILNLSHVDGVLVGGASLKLKDFCKIIDSYQ